MTSLFFLVAASSVLGGTPQSAPACSYLYQPSYCLDYELRGQPRALVPQPGDVMLATKPNLFWTITHDLAGAFEPHSSAIVVAKPDGSLGVMEAGPNNTLYVRVLPLLQHLKEYEDVGRVWIRRRCTPLTAEQSAKLTEFAMRQDGKRFAVIRLGAQVTPIRTRGPVRTAYIGYPHGDRPSYFCSELVLETLLAACLLDPNTTRPSATFPCELFFDRSCNPYLNSHFSLAPQWEPPARWVSHPVPAAPRKSP